MGIVKPSFYYRLYLGFIQGTGRALCSRAHNRRALQYGQSGPSEVYFNQGKFIEGGAVMDALYRFIEDFISGGPARPAYASTSGAQMSTSLWEQRSPGSAVSPAYTSPPPTRKKVKNRGKKRRGMGMDRGKTENSAGILNILEQARVNAGGEKEAGIRQKLLNSFLRASHGDLATFGVIHREALARDPVFYAHIARWYFEKGTIRDHHELFVAHLLTSPFKEHRDHAKVLMQYLRPYQVGRVVKYSKEVLNYSTRALKTAVTLYLRRRENNPLWFDEHVIRRRDAMKYLYATLHIRPSQRASKVLFEDDPPQDSRVYIAKQLEKLVERPDEQARLILKHKIHYTAAMGTIKSFTPAILFALASVMTPQQVINNLKFFERRGALNDRDIRAVVEQKLKNGQKESRVQDFKSLVALSKLNADANLAGELMELTHKRLKDKGQIKVPTALFVDKSGSMEQCIEIGKLLASMCSTIATSDLYVYAFDTNSFEVKPKGNEFSCWERAFAPITANNATSIGAPFSRLMNREVDQIVIISDGEENSAPKFKDMLQKYEKLHNKTLKVFFVKVASNNETPLEKDMAEEAMTVINFNGDYYNLPNVIPMLCAGNSFEMVDEVLDCELYTEESLNHLPVQFDEETFEVL